MNVQSLLKRAQKLEFLSIEEGIFLYGNAPTSELMFVANEIRNIKKIIRIKLLGKLIVI